MSLLPSDGAAQGQARARGQPTSEPLGASLVRVATLLTCGWDLDEHDLRTRCYGLAATEEARHAARPRLVRDGDDAAVGRGRHDQPAALEHHTRGGGLSRQGDDSRGAGGAIALERVVLHHR